MDLTISRIVLKGWVPADHARLAELLKTYMVTAQAEPSFVRYQELVDACVTTMQPKLDALFSHGYFPWMMLVGAEMTPERRKTFPNYSLSNPIREMGVQYTSHSEKTYEYLGKVRTTGLYQYRQENFGSLCSFMTNRSWSFLILSQRPAQEIHDQLDYIYDASDLLHTADRNVALNWQRASLLLCGLNDVVARMFGSADDKYRSLILTYGRNSELPAAIFDGEKPT